MDDIVRRAMAKWPNVPHCYGWLALDARGRWFMRDDRVQEVGPFPLARGSLLQHEKLIDFIQRNYDRDDQGCWYFQNGPQRVYVELEVTPLVLRIGQGGSLATQTGRVTQARNCFVDEQGRLFLDTDHGLGLVHTLDMHAAADLVEAGTWTPVTLTAAELPSRFDFEPSPQARQNEKAGR